MYHNLHQAIHLRQCPFHIRYLHILLPLMQQPTWPSHPTFPTQPVPFHQAIPQPTPTFPIAYSYPTAMPPQEFLSSSTTTAGYRSSTSTSTPNLPSSSTCRRPATHHNHMGSSTRHHILFQLFHPSPHPNLLPPLRRSGPPARTPPTPIAKNKPPRILLHKPPRILLPKLHQAPPSQLRANLLSHLRRLPQLPPRAPIQPTTAAPSTHWLGPDCYG